MFAGQPVTQARRMPQVQVIHAAQGPQSQHRARNLTGLPGQHQHALPLGLKVVRMQPIDHGGRLLGQPAGQPRFSQ